MNEADELALARNKGRLLCSVFGSGQSQTQDGYTSTAIKTSLGLFPGTEALVSILLPTAGFQVTVATGKLPLGTPHHFS